MGYDQKEPLGKYFEEFDTESVEFYQDYEKFDRGFCTKFSYKG
jgi:release factor glutamine methyltransferase